MSRERKWGQVLHCAAAHEAEQVTNGTSVGFSEMLLLCVAAHQPAGIQTPEVQASLQTVNAAAQATSSVTEAQHTSPVPKTSTWTGLVDLDKAGVRSIAGIDNSSEISGEHVVIHLRPEVGRKDGQDVTRSSQENDPQISSNTLGLSDLESVESHGGSAHEEEDGSFLGSDNPRLSSTASSTPQPQTTNSVLAEFVNTLMRPLRHWAGGGEGEKMEKGLSVPEENVGENQTQGEASSRNLSVPNAVRNQGNVDNAITEQRSGFFSFRAPASRQSSTAEGLSEQEREVMPLFRLVPAVKTTGHIQTSTQAGERGSSTSADAPLSTPKGKSPTLISRISPLTLKTNKIQNEEKETRVNWNGFIPNRVVVRLNVVGKCRIYLCCAV